MIAAVLRLLHTTHVISAGTNLSRTPLLVMDFSQLQATLYRKAHAWLRAILRQGDCGCGCRGGGGGGGGGGVTNGWSAVSAYAKDPVAPAFLSSALPAYRFQITLARSESSKL